jgi:putative tricarboxylic transport membrane protein
VTSGPGSAADAGDAPGASLRDAVHRLEADPAGDRPPPLGPAGNLVVAAVVVALGVAAVAGALGLGAGTAAEPGPGTWPLLVGVVLTVLGVALASGFRRTDDAERFTRPALLVLAGLATMAAFVAVVGTIGFEIPAALLAFVWLRFLGHESWRTSVAVSLGVVVAFYLLFVGALDVSIPHLF